MAHKGLKRQILGLFDVPSRPDDEHHEVGVLGGPARDSGLFGGSAQSSGLFDAPDRTPGEMPGLLERPRRADGDGSGQAEKLARAPRGGLFDKPAAGGGLFGKPRLRRR
jgi:hypothetical protein